jgi:hypothetical protein
MDAKCERRFPLHIPDVSSIHLVAVATGARQAAASRNGGDGSLAIATDADGSPPFVIGDLDPKADFVHVFDDVSLSVVLKERDTVADFVDYLRKRAAFLRSGPEILANSELDLLASYMRGMNGREHDFVVPPHVPPPTTIMIDGDWPGFVHSGPYKRKKAADAESYVWDRIIEGVAGHADRGTLVAGQEHGLQGTEELLRFPAAEDRFTRRVLARALNEARRAAVQSDQNVWYRTTKNSHIDNRAYVFIIVRRQGREEQKYRRLRQGLLRAYTEITKLRYEELQAIIGIGVAPADDPDDSVDLVARTYTTWTDENRQSAEELRVKLGWARDVADMENHLHHDEYPAPLDTLPTPTKPRANVKAHAKAKRKAARVARKKNRR